MPFTITMLTKLETYQFLIGRGGWISSINTEQYFQMDVMKIAAKDMMVDLVMRDISFNVRPTYNDMVSIRVKYPNN